MRPIRLHVSAFGPYAGRQVFDFRELGERSLFLISGPTGAGKTTILDAICYSLYGETSGQVRDAVHMRSHHSDASVLTEITFDFALGSDTYRISRRPQQERPKKRGQGTVMVGAEARLWRRTDCTDDEEGEPLATKVGYVAEEIEQLLGFRGEQFRQVVVLPQGRFMELLLANSQERQRILETLFQTELYHRIEEALKRAWRDMEDRLKGLRAQRKALFEAAGVENREQLKARRESVQGALSQCRADLEELRKAREATRQALEEGRKAAERFEELGQATMHLGTLTARSAKIDQKRGTRDRAKRAEALRDVEDQRNQRFIEHEEAKQALVCAQKAEGTADKAKEKALEKLREQKKRQPEIDQIRKEKNHLETLTERVAKITEAREQLSGVQHAAEKATSEHQQAQQSLTHIGEQLEAARAELTRAEKAADRASACQAALQEAKREYADRKKLESVRAEAADLEKEHTKAAKAFEKAKTQLAEAVERLRAMEREVHEKSAAMLARTLRPGEPCPVCGSKEHPAPAAADEELPSLENLEKERSNLQKLDTKRNTAAEKESDLRASVAQVCAEVQLLTKALGDKHDLPLEELKAAVDQRQQEVIEAEQARDACEELREKLNVLKEEKNTAAKAIEELQEKAQKETATVERLSGVVKEREAQVPDALRHPEALQDAIEKTGSKLEQLEKSLRDAEEAANRAAEELAAHTSSMESAGRALEEADLRAKAQAEQFAERLERAGFEDEETYAASKLSDEAIAALAEEIEEYQQDVVKAEQRRNQAEKAASGLEPPDLKALGEKAGKAEETHEEALRLEERLSGEADRVHGWLSKLDDTDRQMQTLDAEHNTLGSIAAVANGDNPRRVAFQRFVLGALLDDVLVAASDRLIIMSKGRYRLQRQEDPFDRRRAAGLDLCVYDAYTGTTRPAATLSGGETFLAALSLALGLADVVQAYAGGIHLDTIFVDEGFGTLDPEALDAVMEALMALQEGGRLVGIISHVPELRERMDTRLEIIAGKKGSTARFYLG